MLLTVVFFSVFISALAQNDPNCGTKGPIGTSRIVGGENTGFLEYPWQISLRRKLPPTGEWNHACGGSIIKDQWILTAAHCINGTDPASYIIRVGEHDTTKNEGTEYDLTVSKVISHESYNQITFNNDLALLKLSQPLNLTGNHSHLGIICIGSKGSDVTGQSCVSTGWGNTKWGGTMPNILRKVTVKVINQTICNNAYGSNPPVTAGMICSGSANKGTCLGDSGGPLQCKIGNKWRQYGATSWAYNCAEANYPSVSVRVTHYVDWIWDKLKTN